MNGLCAERPPGNRRPFSICRNDAGCLDFFDRLPGGLVKGDGALFRCGITGMFRMEGSSGGPFRFCSVNSAIKSGQTAGRSTALALEEKTLCFRPSRRHICARKIFYLLYLELFVFICGKVQEYTWEKLDNLSWGRSLPRPWQSGAAREGKVAGISEICQKIVAPSREQCKRSRRRGKIWREKIFYLLYQKIPIDSGGRVAYNRKIKLDKFGRSRDRHDSA